MFSARASSASAGRASHLLALQSNVSPRRPPPATAARHRPCQQRGYAITPKVPSPTVQRIERVRRSRQPPPPPQSELQPCFRPSAVPPLDFWKACAGDVGLGGLTAEECYNTARQYCAIAVRGDSRWKQALQRGMYACMHLRCIYLSQRKAATRPPPSRYIRSSPCRHQVV